MLNSVVWQAASGLSDHFTATRNLLYRAVHYVSNSAIPMKSSFAALFLIQVKYKICQSSRNCEAHRKYVVGDHSFRFAFLLLMVGPSLCLPLSFSWPLSLSLSLVFFSRLCDILWSLWLRKIPISHRIWIRKLPVASGSASRKAAFHALCLTYLESLSETLGNSDSQTQWSQRKRTGHMIKSVNNRDYDSSFICDKAVKLFVAVMRNSLM